MVSTPREAFGGRSGVARLYSVQLSSATASREASSTRSGTGQAAPLFTHHAHILEANGESCRLRQSRQKVAKGPQGRSGKESS